MTFWIIVSAVAVIIGYLLGRFFKTCVVSPIVVTLDGNLRYVGTVPDQAVVKRGDPVVWEVVIQAANPPVVDITMDFDPQDSPFKKPKQKSGPGNKFFGDRTMGNAAVKSYKYSISVDGTQVADPVIQIRG